jgi:hypothetical protein
MESNTPPAGNSQARGHQLHNMPQDDAMADLLARSRWSQILDKLEATTDTGIGERIVSDTDIRIIIQRRGQNAKIETPMQLREFTLIRVFAFCFLLLVANHILSWIANRFTG